MENAFRFVGHEVVGRHAFGARLLDRRRGWHLDESTARPFRLVGKLPVRLREVAGEDLGVQLLARSSGKAARVALNERPYLHIPRGDRPVLVN